MKMWICSTVILFGALSICSAADMIRLNNGSKIAGTVVSYSDMTFHVQTASGVELKQPAIAVQSIEFADSATPVSLEVHPNGTSVAKVLQFENAKFVVGGQDGTIEKIPASSVIRMQWGQRPPVPERPPTPPRLPLVIRSSVEEPRSTGGNPSKFDLVRGDKEVSLEDHLVRGKVTVIDFYADWCGPCRRLSRHLEDMAAHDSEIALVKINIIDWHSPVTKQFAITSIPRVQVYSPWGKLTGATVGVAITQIDDLVAQAKNSR